MGGAEVGKLLGLKVHCVNTSCSWYIFFWAWLGIPMCKMSCTSFA